MKFETIEIKEDLVTFDNDCMCYVAAASSFNIDLFMLWHYGKESDAYRRVDILRCEKQCTVHNKLKSVRSFLPTATIIFDDSLKTLRTTSATTDFAFGDS